jgi:hypothetical protein
MAYAATRELAHELIDRMAPAQVPVAVELLVKMLDPLTLALANAPFEDEAISAEEELDAAAAMAETGPTTSMEDIFIEMGFAAGSRLEVRCV